MSISKEKKLARRLSRQEKRRPIANDMFIPNLSGDLSKGNVRSTPTADTDPANKAYVDTKGDVTAVGPLISGAITQGNGGTEVKTSTSTVGQIATNVTHVAGDGSDHADVATNTAASHAQSHNVASHNDTTGTGTELNTLTDNSMADTLHRHSELSASDGTPDQALTVDANGRVNVAYDFSVDTNLLFVDIAGNVGVGIGTGTPSEMLDVVGNAEINGNIIVTGTVDGIDIATDVGANTTHRGLTHDYAYISGNDGATDVTAAQLEELSDGSETTLHSHAGNGNGFTTDMVMMWNGTIANIPAGWEICDGGNGKPDLRDSFVRGAGAADEVGATGGSETHTHSITDETQVSAQEDTDHCHHISSLETKYENTRGVCSGRWYYGCVTNCAHKHEVCGYTDSCYIDHVHEICLTTAACSTLPTYYEIIFIIKVAA